MKTTLLSVLAASVALTASCLTVSAGDPLGYPGGYRPMPSRAANFNQGYQTAPRTGLFGLPVPQQWQGSNQNTQYRGTSYNGQMPANCPNGQCGTGTCANGQCVTGQCANGQCTTGQCANGQCTTGQCANGRCATGQSYTNTRNGGFVNQDRGYNRPVTQARFDDGQWEARRPNINQSGYSQTRSNRNTLDRTGWNTDRSWLTESSLQNDLELDNTYFRNSRVQDQSRGFHQNRDDYYGAPARTPSRY